MPFLKTVETKYFLNIWMHIWLLLLKKTFNSCLNEDKPIKDWKARKCRKLVSISLQKITNSNYQRTKGSTHWVDTFSSLGRSQDDVFHLQWAKYILLYCLDLEVLSKNKDCQCSLDDESYCSGNLVQTL